MGLGKRTLNLCSQIQKVRRVDIERHRLHTSEAS